MAAVVAAEPAAVAEAGGAVGLDVAADVEAGAVHDS